MDMEGKKQRAASQARERGRLRAWQQRHGWDWSAGNRWFGSFPDATSTKPLQPVVAAQKLQHSVIVPEWMLWAPSTKRSAKLSGSVWGGSASKSGHVGIGA